MFKNETARVTSKANGTCKRRRSTKKRGIDNVKDSKTPYSSGSDSLGPSRRASTAVGNDANELEFIPVLKMEDLHKDVSWTKDWDPSASLTFNPSIEHQATSFFFENFAPKSKSKETSRGFLDLLAPMYEKTPTNSPLSMATEALAVRTAANFPEDKNLLHHAESLYGRALKAVQRAIQEPSQATSDETLLSILLFSIFESTTTSNIDNWSKHIKGAVSIVRSRGPAQFNNPESLLLFRSTRTQMLTNAISRGENIEKFPGASGWLGDQKDGSTKRLIEHSIRLPGILADAKDLLARPQCLHTIAKVNELLDKAYNLQRKLFDWELNMPSEFAYRTVEYSASTSEDSSESEIIRSDVWRPGSIHVYGNVQVASIRNNNRISQLLCSSVVIDSLKWLDPAGYMEDRRYKAAAYRVRYLVDDITASVPFHYGYRSTEEGLSSEKKSQRTGRKVPNVGNRHCDLHFVIAIDAKGGYFLIWPLLISSSMLEVPAMQRKWLRGRLQLIARQYGLARADIARARAGGTWSGDVTIPIKTGA